MKLMTVASIFSIFLICAANAQNTTPSVDDIFENAEKGVVAPTNSTSQRFMEKLIGVKLLSDHQPDFESKLTQMAQVLEMPIGIDFDALVMKFADELYSDTIKQGFSSRADILFILERAKQNISYIKGLGGLACSTVSETALTLSLYYDGGSEHEERWLTILKQGLENDDPASETQGFKRLYAAFAQAVDSATMEQHTNPEYAAQMQERMSNVKLNDDGSINLSELDMSFQCDLALSLINSVEEKIANNL